MSAGSTGGQCHGCWNSTPGSMLLLPNLHGKNCPCSKSHSVGIQAVSHSKHVCLTLGGHGPVPCTTLCPPPGSASAVTLENSVCSKQPMAECPSMECQSIDLMWLWSCAGLGAHTGQCGICPPVPCWGHPRPVAHSTAVLVGTCTVSTMMGLLWVKGIEALEVKFLDRCKTNCSEGALQVHVCRSRMRVWGAKMIRHRRSPQL